MTLVPALPISPIHWERYGDKPAKVVDVRTLPEDVKVAIIKAAIAVTFRYENGEYSTEEDTPQDDTIAWLAEKVGSIAQHMHEVSLVPCP